MTRKKKSIIEVDGRQYEAKYISKGQYSTVYQVGNRVVMYTRGDCAKEVLAMYQYDKMAHLPEIIRHENTTVRPGSYYNVFSSPFYRNVTTKDRSAWNLMQKIIIDFDYFESYETYNKSCTIDYMQKFVNHIKEDPHMIRSVIRALQELVDVSSNCGYNNIGFDFQKSNFGVNEYGTLIFRDVIWVR